MNLNKAIIAGRLTRDPEFKSLPSGVTVTSLSVVTNRVFKSKDGQKQESADFHNVIVFGAQADACAQFLKKGQIVGVVGRLQTRSWENDGVKHYRTEIVADQVDFGPRASGKEAASPEPDTTTVEPPRPDYYPAEDINPEDIPF